MINLNHAKLEELFMKLSLDKQDFMINALKNLVSINNSSTALTQKELATLKHNTNVADKARRRWNIELPLQ